MGSPTAAALLLAALSALPCHGTDADGTSGIFNSTHNLQERGSQPIVNQVYQMLHITELHNQSINSNISVNIYSPTTYKLDNKECCQIHAKDKHSLSTEGAKQVTELNKDVEDKLGLNRKRRVVNVVRTSDNFTVSEEQSEMTTKVPVVKQRPMDRRRRPGEGSSAPLLNYIFDSYSNVHHHGSASNPNMCGVNRPGTGNSIYPAAAPEVEALVGSTAHLDCKVDALHDKLVSWVRRKNDEDPMDLLTTGTQQYTADYRYSASFIPPDVWRLEIRQVRPSDAAHYDCQLSAHPPRTARVTLKVPEVSVRIVDGAGAEVSEQVCEVGSTVALRCEVRGLRIEGGPSLLWYRRDALLNDDTTRGGISVRTEFGANGANSVLRVARVRTDDAGVYSCAVARAPPPEPSPAHVTLHIIKGESLAELHQGGTAVAVASMWLNVLLAACITLNFYFTT